MNRPRTIVPTMHVPPLRRAHRGRPQRGPLAFILIVLLATGAAAAQNVVTGTIEATVDGEERTWYTMAPEDEERGDPSATWSSMMHITTVNIRAHEQQTWAIDDALSLDLTTFTGLEACPCSIPAVRVTLWTDSGIMENIYVSEDADVVITRFDPIGDEVYEVEGTVEGTLQFHAAVNQDPVPGRSVDISGTFLIEHLPFRALQ